MVRSMTGYGRAETLLAGKKVLVEIRSVNHRYLEISTRLPGSLFPLELDIKKKIGEQLVRGRVDVTVRKELDGGVESAHRFELNQPLAQNYYAMLRQLKQTLQLPDEITVGMFAGMKDIFVPVEAVEDLATVWGGLEQVLDDALSALRDMREKEGEILWRDLMARLEWIGTLLDRIVVRAPQVVADYQKRLTERIRELTAGMDIDETRLCQEVAIMAEKSDITEEIVRFRSHIEQLCGMTKSADAVGRKVDFLIQEMNREVNTIGSKSSDAEISRCVIDIKSEMAKLREQVQNIE
jgi:uncharacterized protein (TIGR00255 family)